MMYSGRCNIFEGGAGFHIIVKLSAIPTRQFRNGRLATRIGRSLESAGDWNRLATGIGRRLESAGDWNRPATGIGRRLESAGDWNRLATGIGRSLESPGGH